MHTLSWPIAVTTLLSQSVLSAPVALEIEERTTTSILSSLTLPEAAAALPAPSGTLTHVYIGRGIQNYTCSSSSSSAVPNPIGAIATLYDASAFPGASSSAISNLMTSLAYSMRLHTLPTSVNDPGIARHFAASDCSTPVCEMAAPHIGAHHYFGNSTTPIFDLGQYGIVTAAKKDNVTAPDTSQEGSVDWLYLEGTLNSKAVQIYRVDTVGGSPTETCEHVETRHQDVFWRNYAAQYWFYE